MNNDTTARAVCLFLGCIIAYVVLMSLLPYVVAFFMIIGMGCLLMQDNQRN